VTLLHAAHVDRSVLCAEAGGVDPIAEGDFDTVARFLRAQLDEAGIPSRGVVLGLGTQDSMIRYTRIPPLPDWRLEVLMQFERDALVERMEEPVAIVHRVLPQHRVLAQQDGRRKGEEAGGPPEQTVLVAHAKEEPLEGLLVALERQGVTVSKAVPSALALFALQEFCGLRVDPDTPEDDLLLLVDLGARTLHLALVLNDRPVFARSIAFGGQQFTEGLQSRLRLEAANAERAKVKRGSLDTEDSRALAAAVQPLRTVAGQLLSTLESTTRFAGSQIGVELPPLSRLSFLGGGMRLRGLETYLAKALRVPGEFFQPQRVEAEDGIAESTAKVLKREWDQFGVSVGLALSGVAEATQPHGVASAGILPTTYARRRRHRERTIFLYAAASLLLVFLLSKLALGWTQNRHASSVREQLGLRQQELTLLRSEMEQNRLEAERRRLRLNFLLREAEQTGFEAFVLDRVSRVLRPELQIHAVAWGILPNGEAGKEEFVLKIQGRANNETRLGLRWIRDLQSTLLAEERIARVEEQSSRPDGGWYTFEFVVFPNYVRY